MLSKSVTKKWCKFWCPLNLSPRSEGTFHLLLSQFKLLLKCSYSAYMWYFECRDLSRDSSFSLCACLPTCLCVTHINSKISTGSQAFLSLRMVRWGLSLSGWWPDETLIFYPLMSMTRQCLRYLGYSRWGWAAEWRVWRVLTATTGPYPNQHIQHHPSGISIFSC